MSRQESMTNKNKKDPQKKHRLGTVSKNTFTGGLKLVLWCQEVNIECHAIKDNLNAFDGRESFNADIMYQEVEAAIQKIKAGNLQDQTVFIQN